MYYVENHFWKIGTYFFKVKILRCTANGNDVSLAPAKKYCAVEQLHNHHNVSNNNSLSRFGEEGANLPWTLMHMPLLWRSVQI